MAGVLRRAVLGGLAACASAGAARARPARPADLEGVWTLGSYTDLERPPALHGLVLTPAEAEAYEAPRRKLRGMAAPAAEDVLGQAEAEFNERGDGLARVRGQIRSSWIVDPPDGKIPFTPEGLAVLARVKTEQFANPEGLYGTTQCLANGAAGAPMSGGPDANLFQLVQTPAAVVIVSEKYHDARIIRMAPQKTDKNGADKNGAAQAPPQPPQWTGDGVGHWEGATLVVETTGGHPGAILRGGRVFAAETTRVTERFTRTARDELLYEFTVEDPVLYARSWRAEMALRPAPGPMYEFACHEGNYSLPGILAGARLEEREAAAKGGK